MHSGLVLVIVVATALAFDFTNGFHDTANVVATSISTRALPPRVAVSLASLLNFAGAFISLKVAATVAQGFVSSGSVDNHGRVCRADRSDHLEPRDLVLRIPSSSSHALIGGLVGAVLVASGAAAVNGHGLLTKLIVPAVIAPVLAFTAAALAITLAYRLVGGLRPGHVTRNFRAGQVVSGGLLALSHGTNDAQKTMGVITLALIAHGTIKAKGFHVPDWVVIAAGAIALGTFTGGWRIIRTMGSRIIKMDPPQGFAAQGAGAAVILAASGAAIRCQPPM